MHKAIIQLIIYSCSHFYLFAQYDKQVSIVTDDGIFTVSKTDEGNDMILLNTALWDDMVRGTKYISTNLWAIAKEKTCLHISNRNCMHCTAGVGFRCGIFNCANLADRIPLLVNNENRICSVRIQRTDTGTVKLIFLDKVDWYSLQNDQ